METDYKKGQLEAIAFIRQDATSVREQRAKVNQTKCPSGEHYVKPSNGKRGFCRKGGDGHSLSNPETKSTREKGLNNGAKLGLAIAGGVAVTGLVAGGIALASQGKEKEGNYTKLPNRAPRVATQTTSNSQVIDQDLLDLQQQLARKSKDDEDFAQLKDELTKKFKEMGLIKEEPKKEEVKPVKEKAKVKNLEEIDKDIEGIGERIAKLKKMVDDMPDRPDIKKKKFDSISYCLGFLDVKQRLGF